MKKDVLRILLFFFIFTLLIGCTVEKRLYESGYHVSWNKPIKKSKHNNDLQQENIEKEIVINEKVLQEEVSEPINSSIEEIKEPVFIATNDDSEIISTIVKEDRQFSINNEHKNESIQESQITKSEIPQNNKDLVVNNNNIEEIPKVHWGAIAGFICGIVSIFIFGIIFSIAGAVFSAIALTAISQNPGKYRGQGLAIAGLIISVICIVLSIMAIAALAAV